MAVFIYSGKLSNAARCKRKASHDTYDGHISAKSQPTPSLEGGLNVHSGNVIKQF